MVEHESRKRFDRGMSVVEAARDIDLGEFRKWSGAERLIQNVDHCYRGIRGEKEPISRPELYRL